MDDLDRYVRREGRWSWVASVSDEGFGTCIYGFMTRRAARRAVRKARG